MNCCRISPNNTSFDEDHSQLDKSSSDDFVYLGLRLALVIVGLIGNICTLIIIAKLKHRVNGHIIMVYLAVSDILVCCMLPMSYLKMSSTIYERHWKNFCIISEYFYTATMTYSVISYITASIDRYVMFIHSLCFQNLCKIEGNDTQLYRRILATLKSCLLQTERQIISKYYP